MIDVVYHGDNLKNMYVFDSIRLTKKYMPWVHKIFILYDDTKKENIDVVVSNPDYNWIPITSYLPKRFRVSINNSCIVESWLWKCKDISESFVYFCDDMFVGRPISQDDLFLKDRPIVRILPGGPNHRTHPKSTVPYAQMMENAITKHGIQYTRVSHTASPYKKSLLKMYYGKYKDVVDEASLNNHERAGYKDFNVLRLSSSLMIMDGNAFMQTATEDFFCESHEESEIKRIPAMKPKFFCVNNLTSRNTILDAVLKKV